MKKIKFISAIALTMMMASCDNYDLPNPPSQTNPEPDGFFENSGLVLTQGDKELNLITLNEANEFAKVASVTELVNFPDTYTLSIDMQVAADESFSNFTTIATTLNGDVVTVNPDFLNGAIQEVKTKQPGTYDIYTRYVAYAERGTTRMRLGGIDATYLPATYKVTTLNPDKVMEQSYYIVGDFCDWDVKKAVKMNNTLGDGVSVYDNPEFAIKLDIPAGKSLYWKVIPASAYEAKSLDAAFGCNPAEGGLSGKLVPVSGKNNAGEINLIGQALVTINVESDSYRVSYALEVLYPLSGSTMSKPNNAMLLYTDNYINYTGVTAISQQWILAGQPDQRGDIIFKQDPNVDPVISEDGLTQTGVMTALEEGVKFRSPVKNCLYWCDVNLIQMTYSITALKTLSVIGSANGWDLATAVELTPSKDFKVWTASNVEIGDEFKINANGAWAVGFSGTSIPDETGKYVYQVNKQDGGDNLKCPAPGKYNVIVDFSTRPYIVTLEK